MDFLLQVYCNYHVHFDGHVLSIHMHDTWYLLIVSNDDVNFENTTVQVEYINQGKFQLVSSEAKKKNKIRVIM